MLPRTRGSDANKANASRYFIPGGIVQAFVLLILTMIFIAPLLWIVATSFKTGNDATSLPLSWQPHPATTAAYRTVLTTSSQTPVLRWFFNSLLAGAINAVLVVAVDALAAYALARMAFRGRRIVFGTVKPRSSTGPTSGRCSGGWCCRWPVRAWPR